MRLNKNQSGFTLVEVTIILLVLVILSTIMLPQLGNFNRLARFVKAREDVGAICATLKKMLDEVMLGTVYKNPATRAEPLGVLNGPGDIPIAGNQGDGECTTCAGTNDLTWRLATNAGPFNEAADNNAPTFGFRTGDLANHLMRNLPDPATVANKYKNPIDDPARSAAGAFFGWRGPYLDELTTDPWNNRYAVNTFALYDVPNAAPPTGVFSSAVVCYSAGPDGSIDTEINQPMNIGGAVDGASNFGWQFGADDIGAILSAGGAF